jgi:biotin transport system substrate-specific component
MKMSVRTMTQVALFSVLAIIGAQVRFPLLMIPFTLQFAVCLMTGILLGARKALLAQLVYLILGLAGLPVFAAGGGPAYILQPSFGYLVGMLLAAGLVGWLADHFDPDRSKLKFWQLLPINLAGKLVVDVLGVSYLYLIKNFYAGQNLTVWGALQAGMIPFMVSDGFFCIAAALAGPSLRRLTRTYFFRSIIQARVAEVKKESKGTS